MVKSNTQLADSKNAQQNVTKTRWIILSRLRSEHQRKLLDLGDKWASPVEFYDERKAGEELSWLMNHCGMREYMFIEETDYLDDDIPFLN